MDPKRLLDRTGHRIGRALRGGRHDTREALNADRDLAGRFCGNPFAQLDVYQSGDAHVCCSGWLPTPIGNLKKQPLEEIWNSPHAEKIRESIFDGSFRYCDHKVCPYIQNDSLPTLNEAARDPRFTALIESRTSRLDTLPTFVNLCNDPSCNLQCPSCRTHRINFTKGREFEELKALQDRLVESLFDKATDRHFRISVTGSGDPFASKIFREFLFGLDGSRLPNLEISLQTNGVLLTPRTWQRMRRIRDNITDIIVSFDAAMPETYAITRKGGHWPTLIDNTRALGELRRTGELRFLKLDFVVQQANYTEMPAFVELGRELGADRVGFSLLMNWGTWRTAEFNVRCIWRRDHPEFARFLDTMRDDRLGDPIVDLGNVSAYREAARDLYSPRHRR